MYIPLLPAISPSKLWQFYEYCPPIVEGDEKQLITLSDDLKDRFDEDLHGRLRKYEHMISFDFVPNSLSNITKSSSLFLPEIKSHQS